MSRFNKPADLWPYPVICRGTALLASDYAGGDALTVYNSAGTSQQTFAFQSDGSISGTDIDTFIGTDYGKVVTLFGQVGGRNSQSDLDGAPRIKQFAIGDHRVLGFEGGGRSDNVSPPPNINFLATPSLDSLNVTAKDYCYMAVVQATSAVHVNQSSGLERGTLLHLAYGGLDVLRIVNDGEGDGVTGGYWNVGDGTFSLTAADLAVETCPGVLTVLSDTSGVRLYWNEEIIASASRSALTRTAGNMFNGKLINSASGGTSGAFDGWLAAEMLWPSITARDAATRRVMLYELFDIDFRRSRPKSKGLVFCGDSNMANYKVVGRNGWEKQMQASMSDVRFYNFAMEGSTILLNPADPRGASSRYYNIGLFPNNIRRPIHRAEGDIGFIIDNNGNDFGISPQPTAADVYAGYLTLLGLARAANASVKCFITTGTEHHGSSYTSLQASVATLVRNGAVANNYTTIDFMADSALSQYPSIYYADANHRSEDGHARCAAIATPVIKAAFGWT